MINRESDIEVDDIIIRMSITEVVSFWFLCISVNIAASYVFFALVFPDLAELGVTWQNLCLLLLLLFAVIYFFQYIPMALREKWPTTYIHADKLTISKVTPNKAKVSKLWSDVTKFDKYRARLCFKDGTAMRIRFFGTTGISANQWRMLNRLAGKHIFPE